MPVKILQDITLVRLEESINEFLRENKVDMITGDLWDIKIQAFRINETGRTVTEFFAMIIFRGDKIE